MPDNLSPANSLSEDVAKVPEEDHPFPSSPTHRPASRQPMIQSASLRSPLRTYSMNDCEGMASVRAIAAEARQSWIAFNKSKLQEIFEATLTEMTNESNNLLGLVTNRRPSSLAEDESSRDSMASSAPDGQKGEDEKENERARRSSPVRSLNNNESQSSKDVSDVEPLPNGDKEPPDAPANPEEIRSGDEGAVAPPGEDVECQRNPTPESPSGKASTGRRHASGQKGKGKSGKGDGTKRVQGKGQGQGKGPTQSKGQGQSKPNDSPGQDHWVALNKAMVFDLVDSAMNALDGPEVLDLTADPPADPKSPETPAPSEENETGGKSRAPKRKSARGKSKPNKRKKEDPSINAESKSGKKADLRTPSGSQGAEGIDTVLRTLLSQSTPASSSKEDNPDKERQVTGAASDSDIDSQSTEVSECGETAARGRAHSLDSPQHGWVALSKSDVHTIVDSVMTSVFLRSVPSQDPSAPPDLPHFQLRPPPRPKERRVSFSSVEQLAKGSPPESPPRSPAQISSGQESPSAQRPFKWKSNMMRRAQSRESTSSPESVA